MNGKKFDQDSTADNVSVVEGLVDKPEQQDHEVVSSRKFKLCQTAVMALGIGACGMCLNLRGPTLLDLQRLTQSSLAQISAAVFTSISLGWVLGAIGGGALLDRYNQQLILTISGICCGIFTAVIPFCSNIVLLAIASCLQGIFFSVYDAGALSLCFRLWSEKAAPYVQAMDLIFSIGCLISPVVVEGLLKLSPPYHSIQNNNISEILLEKVELSTNKQRTLISVTPPLEILNETCGDVLSPDKANHYFWLAYVIFAVLTLFTAFPYCINTITKVQIYKPKDPANANSTKSKEEGRFMIKILVLIAIFSFTYNAIEDLTGGLMKNFAVTYLCWTESQGNLLLTVFWTCYTLTRIVGIIEVVFLHPGTVIIIHFTIMTVSFYLLLFVKHYEALMWVCAIFIAVGISPIFSNRMSWTDRYVKMTGKIMGFIFVMEGIGSMVWPPIVGVLVDKYGPLCFIYMLCILGTFNLFLFIAMHVIAQKHGSRYPARNASIHHESNQLNT